MNRIRVVSFHHIYLCFSATHHTECASHGKFLKRSGQYHEFLKVVFLATPKGQAADAGRKRDLLGDSLGQIKLYIGELLEWREVHGGLVQLTEEVQRAQFGEAQDLGGERVAAIVGRAEARIRNGK